MLKEKILKYIIDSNNRSFIISKLESFTDSPELIMDDSIMTRAIYTVSNEPSLAHEISWLRIRVGDVNCERINKCTITYKSKQLDSSEEKYAKLDVDDFYEARNMFQLLGFVETSIQETKRTKYSCYYEKVKYLVCFDVWPGLEEITFLTIEPGLNAEPIDVKGFKGLLNLEKYIINDEKPVDVDQEYYVKYNFVARHIPQLLFNYFPRSIIDKNVAMTFQYKHRSSKDSLLSVET